MVLFEVLNPMIFHLQEYLNTTFRNALASAVVPKGVGHTSIIQYSWMDAAQGQLCHVSCVSCDPIRTTNEVPTAGGISA